MRLKKIAFAMIGLFACVCLITVSGLQGSVGESISAKKCKEYGKVFQNTCNERTFPGGREAKLGEFPYMAALKYKTNEGDLVLRCSGALISKNYVVAPAYCINTRELGRVAAVTLGQITVDDKQDSTVQEIKVLDVTVHPNYNHRNKSNVIGLIKLEKDVEFNKNVNPICLNENDVQVDKLMASGWNPNSYSHDQEQYVNRLLKNMINTYTQDKCKEIYNTSKAVITDDLFCAGYKQKQCDAQPSGTVQVENKDVKCMDSLVGIVNFGKGLCGGNDIPDVYTKIKPYVPWIESIIWA